MNDLVFVIRDSIPSCVVDGKLSVQLLAEATGVSRQNIWQRIIRDGMVSADMARMMIALPGSSLTADRILPYIR